MQTRARNQDIKLDQKVAAEASKISRSLDKMRSILDKEARARGSGDTRNPEIGRILEGLDTIRDTIFEGIREGDRKALDTIKGQEGTLKGIIEEYGRSGDASVLRTALLGLMKESSSEIKALLGESDPKSAIKEFGSLSDEIDRHLTKVTRASSRRVMERTIFAVGQKIGAASPEAQLGGIIERIEALNANDGNELKSNFSNIEHHLVLLGVCGKALDQAAKSKGTFADSVNYLKGLTLEKIDRNFGIRSFRSIGPGSPTTEAAGTVGLGQDTQELQMAKEVVGELGISAVGMEIITVIRERSGEIISSLKDMDGGNGQLKQANIRDNLESVSNDNKKLHFIAEQLIKDYELSGADIKAIDNELKKVNDAFTAFASGFAGQGITSKAVDMGSINIDGMRDAVSGAVAGIEDYLKAYDKIDGEIRTALIDHLGGPEGLREVLSVIMAVKEKRADIATVARDRQTGRKENTPQVLELEQKEAGDTQASSNVQDASEATSASTDAGAPEPTEQVT